MQTFISSSPDCCHTSTAWLTVKDCFFFGFYLFILNIYLIIFVFHSIVFSLFVNNIE